MKKIVFSIFILMAAAFLTACSSGSSAEKKVIEVALWDENVKGAVDASIEAFNEIHPDVEVKVTEVEGSRVVVREIPKNT